MIQDIDTNIPRSFLSSFVDDTRLMKEISNNTDVQFLQDDLDVVYKWKSSNNMQLSGLKFEHLKYGKNEELKEHSNYLSDTDFPIETKMDVKDLGVTLDVNRTYSKHITNQIEKVKSIIAWIYRTFKTRERQVMLTLWKSLVFTH